ncbi:MAG: GNAT family N-acetyltransferase [Tabrizicola sp.]
MDPGEADQVLAADVFDWPATLEGTRQFLGNPDAANPRNILMIAERDGQIVGFASDTVLDHPDKPRNPVVQEVGVNDAAQRQGIGRALVIALRDEGRKLGCQVTWVLTEAENTPARGLYTGTGGAETTGIVMVEWDEDKG